VASKSGQQEPEKAEVIEELLDALDTALDRVKVLYEQYFLGIQKQPPAYLHTDIERKIRDLTQIQIRNTALRYRFATLQQKYGSYNSYWRRTLRQIENGTYARNLSKVGRQAAKTGAAVPEEILAAMPKRMRDQVVRDREAALALARLRERQAQDDELLTLADEDVEIDVRDLDTDLDPAAFIRESSDVRRNALTAAGAYRVDESDAEFDVDAFFESVTQDDAPARDTLSRLAVAEPPAEGAERSRRASRPSSRPPVVARIGHPRPASASGSPVAAGGAGGRVAEPEAPARSRRPSTKRPPTDEGPPSFAEAAGATRRITGAIRAVRPPSSPGVEPAPPRSATGRMSVVPPPHDDAEPRRSIPPVSAASPAAATRKITGPMRTVRPPSDSDPEPVVSPASAAPDRAGPAAAPRPAPSGDAPPRLSIPPIGAASPAAATRRITPPARAAHPPPNPDPDPPGPASSAAPPGRASAERRAVAPPPGGDAEWGSGLAIRITGASRAVAAPASGDPGPASGATAPSRAAAPAMPASGPSTRDAAGPAEATSPPAARDAGAFAAESTQRSGPAAIPVIPPVIPPGGAKTPTAPSGQPSVPPPAGRADPAWTAPSQAARPLRVAPGSAAAHSATAVETLTGPFPRIPSSPSSLAPSRSTAAPPEPPPIPPMPPLSPATPPKRPDPTRHAAAERPPPESRQAPPPGMTDAEVNALYAKYVKAKQILGEEAEPGTYGKLLRTINAQAPKIMAQYKAKGVDFSVVVKDNQVIIRAKPKP